MPKRKSAATMRRINLVWILRPFVFWVTSAQFAPDLGIEPLPETRQIAGGLQRPLIRRQQMNDDCYSAIRDSRRFPHAKEILQARSDPGWFSGFVVHFGLAAAG